MRMKADRAAARRRLLREILTRRRVSKQEELLELLERSGYRVTQATVSRDLAAIGAEKVAVAGGGEQYVVAELARVASNRQPAMVNVLRSYLVSLSASGNLLVIRTLPAGAGPVAAAIDGAGMKGVLGTIAGDDTVLVIAARASGGDGLKQRFEELVGGR
jgi:transcriptional regulator of arginine metabolism